MSKSLRPLLRHGARRGLPTLAGFSRGNTTDAAHSRRDVLRLGAQGLAAALLAPALGALPGCANGKNKTGTVRANKKLTVIVVGAGFSGLACADNLVHGGADVIVLEATARPGGRVRTDRSFIPGDCVELGGEWIGRNHPTWLAYAQEFNLRLEQPGAAPPPPPETTIPSTEPSTTEPSAPGTQPGAVTPKPEHLETEMDPAPVPAPAPAPDAGRQSNAARRSPAMLALFAQQDAQPQPEAQPDAQPPADAKPAQPAPADQAPTEQPPADTAPGGTPKTESAPATQPSTTTASAGGEEEGIILHGKLIRGAAADALHKEVDAVLAKLIALARGVDPIRPWTSPNAAELDARNFAAFIDEQQGLSDDARALMRSSAETDNGVVAEHMSLLAYLAMVAGGGFQAYYEDSEIYRLADGNDALATALAQKLGDRVRFNSAVDLVRRENDGVIVRTRDGAVFRGDAVVVTVPPSVWERIQLLPPLSQAVGPQMGENVKLILALREPVWERQGLSPEVTSDGMVGMTWAGSDPLGRPPVALTLFSGATQAEELRRQMPDRRNAAAMEAVAPAFPDLPALVLRSRFVDWPGMPLTRASYSFPAPGQVTAFGPTLVDGVRGDGRAPLMFAGEHTAYGFVGYMEGALSSGVRVAHALLAPPPRMVGEAAPAETMPAETQPATPPAEMQPAATQPAETPRGPAAPNEPSPTDAAPPEPAPKPAEPPPQPAEPEPKPQAAPAEDQNKAVLAGV